MKNLFKLATALLIISSILSFSNKVSTTGEKYKDIQENETISFGMNHLTLKNHYTGSNRRHAYDNSQYDIRIDKKGKILLSSVFGCQDKHQNELSVFNGGGTIHRSNDTIIINVKTKFKNFYFFKLEKGKSPDEFSSDVEIKLVSKTLNNDYCPSLVSTDVHGLELVALPSKIAPDEIHKKNHKDATVGVFSYLSLTDSKGKTVDFKEGDYVLLGGNSLKQEP